MPGVLPLFLLPGYGADYRFFDAQVAALPSVVAVRRPRPQRDETLPEYARRVAREIDPGGPCLVGGHSFGGMLALEMTPHLQARACLLISTIRSPGEFPVRMRLFWPLARFTPWALAGLPPATVRLVLRIGGRRIPPRLRWLAQQFADTDGDFLKWAGLAINGWKASFDEPPVPVVQLHGARDIILPARRTRPDVLVPDGGHLLPMTHAELVNDFLREQLERFSG